MSMPQFLVIAVISVGRVSHDFGPERAATVAAILEGEQGHLGLFVFPTAAGGGVRLSLSKFGLSKGLFIYPPTYPRLLNPQEIDVWLALDKTGEEFAKQRIKQAGGPANKDSYYRVAFPNPVIRCGFPVPDPPPDPEPDYEEWFTYLTMRFTPWKDRINNELSASS